jgi:3-methylfumaryl-CoA hydratase
MAPFVWARRRANRLRIRRTSMTLEELQQWVGRSRVGRDVACAAPLRGLAALLDHETPPWQMGQLPPLGHWFYFLPHERQCDIAADGHAKRGDFLPPISLPRRMWAGGRIEFLQPISIGAELERVSTITSITPKDGSSGHMVFVVLRHEIRVNGQSALIEEQDIVYREPAVVSTNPPAVATPGPVRAADAKRLVTLDAVQLFRFSALTFNGHRIHYDRDYARDVEHYDGLVVHGPFSATLLLDLLLRNQRCAIRRFSFRALRPVFDSMPIHICLARRGDGYDLWSQDVEGHLLMSATAEVVPT